MSKAVPDRWLDYKPYGEVINGTRIMAFKVPLKEGIARNLEPDQRFTPASLLKDLPKLKYVVDLTNTAKYYDHTEFTKHGVKYQKVSVPGIQVPSLDFVKKFFKAIETFSAECAADEIIGVHCTHGINRTGYLICRYLVQQLDWEHAEALKEFAAARGYPVERAPYIADLEKAPKGEKLDTSKVVLPGPPSNSRQGLRNRNNKRGPSTQIRPNIPPFPLMAPRAHLRGPPGGYLNGGPMGPAFPPGPFTMSPRLGPGGFPPSRGGPPQDFGARQHPHHRPQAPPVPLLSLPPRHHPPGPPGPMPPPPQQLPLPLFPVRGRFGGPAMRGPGAPPPPPQQIPPLMSAAPFGGPRPLPGRPSRIAAKFPPGNRVLRKHASSLRAPPAAPASTAPPGFIPPLMSVVPNGPVPAPLMGGPVTRSAAGKPLRPLMDFTADEFEDNLAGVPVAFSKNSTRKRPYPRRR